LYFCIKANQLNIFENEEDSFCHCCSGLRGMPEQLLKEMLLQSYGQRRGKDWQHCHS
jgi:hypothetical protein